jgi:D-inositol-3-phosphate glycosyltransferase
MEAKDGLAVLRDPMRAAIIEPVGGHGGMHLYDFGLAGGLAENGVDVTLFTSAETPTAGPTARFNIVHAFVGVWGKAHKFKRLLPYLYGIVRSILSSWRSGTEIVHFHFFAVTPLEVVFIVLAKLVGLKIVITAHDVESFAGDHNKVLSAKIYRAADRVIAHNELSRRELIEKLHVANDRIAIIPHGNYLAWLGDPMSKEEARRHLNLPCDVPIALFFGAIRSVKRLDLLLSAMPRVLREQPSAHLVIAGRSWKGESFGQYQELIDKMAIRDNVVTDLRPYIPDVDARKYFRAADVVVLPYERIYQSGVLLMAMSFAQPVLVSDIPGMLELVEDGVNGLTFEKGSAEKLAAKLCKLLEDPELRCRIAKGGYRSVADACDWTRIGALTATLYRRVLQR